MTTIDAMNGPTEVRFGQYRIWEMDKHNVCVEYDTGKLSKDRDGNPTGGTIKEFVGYYGSFGPALQSAFRHGLKGHGATDARNLMSHIDHALAAIERAVAAIERAVAEERV